MNDFFIYSDENNINDKIKTTIVSLDYTTKAYLRLTTLFTIYSVELCDIILTATITVFNENLQIIKNRLIICVNN